MLRMTRPACRPSSPTTARGASLDRAPPEAATPSRTPTRARRRPCEPARTTRRGSAPSTTASAGSSGRSGRCRRVTRSGRTPSIPRDTSPSPRSGRPAPPSPRPAIARSVRRDRERPSRASTPSAARSRSEGRRLRHVGRLHGRRDALFRHAKGRHVGQRRVRLERERLRRRRVGDHGVPIRRLRAPRDRPGTGRRHHDLRVRRRRASSSRWRRGVRRGRSRTTRSGTYARDDARGGHRRLHAVSGGKTYSFYGSLGTCGAAWTRRQRRAGDAVVSVRSAGRSLSRCRRFRAGQTCDSSGLSLYVRNFYDGQGFAGGSYPGGRLTQRIGYNRGLSPTATVTEQFAYSAPSGRCRSRRPRPSPAPTATRPLRAGPTIRWASSRPTGSRERPGPSRSRTAGPTATSPRSARPVSPS